MDVLGWKDAFAVIRIHNHVPKGIGDLTTDFTIKEIALTEAIASAEVERLNKVNGWRGCIYVWKPTRLRLAGWGKTEASERVNAQRWVHLYAVVSVLQGGLCYSDFQWVEVLEVMASKGEAIARAAC